MKNKTKIKNKSIAALAFASAITLSATVQAETNPSSDEECGILCKLMCALIPTMCDERPTKEN